jgi:hypothetical protein
VVHPGLGDVSFLLVVPSHDSSGPVISWIAPGNLVHVTCDGLLDSELKEIDFLALAEVDEIHDRVIWEPRDEESSRFTGKDGGNTG